MANSAEIACFLPGSAAQRRLGQQIVGDIHVEIDGVDDELGPRAARERVVEDHSLGIPAAIDLEDFFDGQRLQEPAALRVALFPERDLEW